MNGLIKKNEQIERQVNAWWINGGRGECMVDGGGGALGQQGTLDGRGARSGNRLEEQVGPAEDKSCCPLQLVVKPRSLDTAIRWGDGLSTAPSNHSAKAQLTTGAQIMCP